ncbi:hypothetical protein D0T66_01565 [Dysgonomonas sp. 25]|nr:hypothetical protein [Dysgonomonas sp. 25]
MIKKILNNKIAFFVHINSLKFYKAKKGTFSDISKSFPLFYLFLSQLPAFEIKIFMLKNIDLYFHYSPFFFSFV